MLNRLPLYLDRAPLYRGPVSVKVEKSNFGQLLHQFLVLLLAETLPDKQCESQFVTIFKQDSKLALFLSRQSQMPRSRL